MGNKVSNPQCSGRDLYQAIYGPPPGKFCATSHGSTHYIVDGPADGQLVILQHGLGSSAVRFQKIADDLVALGYQVLRYDFYDRGYSESDPNKYPIKYVGRHPLAFTEHIYKQQLRDVLESLNLDKKDYVHCGHSMGGLTGIVSTAESTNTNVKGLILMDTVCFAPDKPLVARLADIPIIGNVLVSYMGSKTYIGFVKGSVVDPDMPEIQVLLKKLEENTYSNPRYFASIRSTNGNCKGMVGSAEQEFRACCQKKIPIHLIWGKADASTPYKHCIRLNQIATELGADISEESFEGMPHNIQFPDAKPEDCSKSICSFVEKAFALC